KSSFLAFSPSLHANRVLYRKNPNREEAHSGAGGKVPNLRDRFVLRRTRFIRLFMPKLVSERIKKLREEIAEISEANRTQMHRRDGGAAADQERRLQRLQEILDELMTLTDWKKT